MIFPKESLFALSLIPYLGFLWCLIRSKQAPTLAIIGFSLTLLFVAVTIPAGLFAFRAYGQTLANVDWLHGGAEAFLTLANIFVVLGFDRALRQARSTRPQ
jgi:dolichyl-phosphate-mannose--protein O-mannosyl transferase